MSFNLQLPEHTWGITRVIVHPVWTMMRSRLNIRWNGKTRQNVIGLTFGSAIINDIFNKLTLFWKKSIFYGVNIIRFNFILSLIKSIFSRSKYSRKFFQKGKLTNINVKITFQFWKMFKCYTFCFFFLIKNILPQIVIKFFFFLYFQRENRHSYKNVLLTDR